MSFAEKMTQFAVGPPILTANLATGFFNLGVETGARSGQVGLRLLEVFVPAARPMNFLSRDVGERAARARRRSFDFAFKSFKMALGRLEDEDFDHLADDELPPGFNQLMADTLAGPMSGMFSWPLSVMLDFVQGANEVDQVSDNLRIGRRIFDALMDAFSVSGEHTRLDTADLRDHFFAMTVGPSGAVIKDIVELLEGSMRFGVGNTKKLARAIEAGVSAMEYPVAYKEEAGLIYPDIPILEPLYEAAKKIVDNEPKRLIEALEDEDPGAILRALADERDEVATFFFYYQWALVQVGISVFVFLRTGLRDVNDVERYVLAENALVSGDLKEHLEKIDEVYGNDPDVRDRKKQKLIYEELELRGHERPFTITEFEFYVGNARSKDHPDDVATLHPDLPAGPFPQATINYAQETAFAYSLLLLDDQDDDKEGRDKALARVERLFGESVRRRIQYDPSLVPIRFRQGLGMGTVEPNDRDSEEAFEDFVDKGRKEYHEGKAIKDELEYYDYLIEEYDERLVFLNEYRDNPANLLIMGTGERVNRRIEILTWAKRRVRLRRRKLQDSTEGHKGR